MRLLRARTDPRLLTARAGVIITSLISWALVPTFACRTSLPACSALARGTLPSAATCCTRSSNAGWRYALYTLGGLSVAAFFARFFLFTFYESPQFLVNKGRDAEACAVVRCAARVNGRESAIDVSELEEVDARFVAVEAAEESTKSAIKKSAEDAKDAGAGGSAVRGSTMRGSRVSGVRGSRMSGARASRMSARSADGAEEGTVEVPAMGGHLQTLFCNAAMVRLTLLTWVCYAADYW